MSRLDLGKVVPEKGVDYYTTSDKAEMVAETKAEVLEEIVIPTKTSDLQNDSGYITNSVNDLTNYTLATNTGSTIELSINSSTYVMTLNLKNSAGTTISTGTIDLPLESVVVGGRYDDTTKKVILTLQNGNTVEFSIADLVDGLVSFTDYANESKAGVIKPNSASYGTNVSPTSGVLYGSTKTYQDYQSFNANGFISKGTLENVITGKDLTTKAYVDGLVGDIATAIDGINREVI